MSGRLGLLLEERLQNQSGGGAGLEQPLSPVGPFQPQNEVLREVKADNIQC